MTKKDYKIIAGVIARYKERLSGYSDTQDIELTVVRELTEELARAMHHDNPRFDKDKFYKACTL